MPYRKVLPVITLSEFLKRASDVKSFASSSGKRYEVVQLVDDIMHFRRLDAKQGIWEMDLHYVFKAYIELEDYATKKFAPYVPRRHSPARGLLLHLQLLAG